jgi:hypothetical protein
MKMYWLFLCICLHLWGNAYDTDAYKFMDALALSAGTDKSSNHHNYTRIYSQYFSHFKNDPIKFLEIGIFKGNSVKFWEDYFPNAELHFIDVNSMNILYHSMRSHYHFIDQAHAIRLKRFAEKYGPFDVILDDGGHTMNQQITSFNALFSSIKPGGLYIIEDLHTSHWKTYGGSGNLEEANEGTAVGYLKSLVDHVNFPGAASGVADVHKLPEDIKCQMHWLRESIEAIHFYTSLCIIEKKR